MIDAPASRRRHTLAGAVELHGVGLHHGERVRCRLAPAEADRGRVFVRTDQVGRGSRR